MSQGMVQSFAEVYPELAPGSLVTGEVDSYYAQHWAMANAASFRPRVQELA